MRSISEINLGTVDGKFEYIVPQDERDESFYGAYLIPKNVNISNISNRRTYFVEGFRGTGKTSLLRWLAHNKRGQGKYTEFVLFKSDIPEEKRSNLSSQVGITWLETDRGKLEFSQDFKASWTWFILHKIGEVLQRIPDQPTQARDYLRLCGLSNNVFKKVMGFLPKLEKLTVEIAADLEFFSSKLGAELTPGGDKKAFTTLTALNDAIITELCKLRKDLGIYILFDELEVFYDEKSKFERDQRMVRDLLFSTSLLNERMAQAGLDIHVVAAVRSEVLDGFGSLGQEVERVVHDRGVTLAWHFARRSLEHPLFKMLARKIRISESIGDGADEEVILRYFDSEVKGEPIENYLLDRSFYKSRDLIWRLTIVQKHFPDETRFSHRILADTENEYSSVMWDEVKYELSANYSKTEIGVIESILSGFKTEFVLEELAERVSLVAQNSLHTREFTAAHGISDVLHDLYRLGAIGNFFREGIRSDQYRNRWAFRGDPTLLLHKRMTINPSLIKRLSMVVPRPSRRVQQRKVRQEQVVDPKRKS